MSLNFPKTTDSETIGETNEYNEDNRMKVDDSQDEAPTYGNGNDLDESLMRHRPTDTGHTVHAAAYKCEALPASGSVGALPPTTNDCQGSANGQTREVTANEDAGGPGTVLRQ